MSSSNDLSKIPSMASEDDAPAHYNRFEAYCAFMGFLPLLKLATWNAAAPQAPPANATAERKAEYERNKSDRTNLDAKCYGAFMLSLDKVPDLQDRLKARAEVIAHPFSGAVLLNEFRKEIFENPNVTVYENKLARIQSFDGSKMSADAAIIALDRLYAGLSKDATPVDKVKVLHLRKQLNREFGTLARDLQDREPNITYADACRRLRAAELNRPPSSSRSGENESINLADASDGESSESVAYAGTGNNRAGNGRARAWKNFRSRNRTDERHQRRRGNSDRGRSPRRDGDRQRGRGRGHSRDNRSRSYSRSRSRESSYSTGRSSDGHSDKDDRQRGRGRGRPNSPAPKGILKKVRFEGKCWDCDKYGHKAGSSECGRK